MRTVAAALPKGAVPIAIAATMTACSLTQIDAIAPLPSGGDATVEAAGAGSDGGAACAPLDPAPDGGLALSTFVLTGVAVYDENADRLITLTNNSTYQAGAAWYPTTMPPLSRYDLTWSFRVAPGNTDGEGITFAVLSSDGAPTVGDDGDGLGLRNIRESGGDGGIPSGYAVEIVMYDNTTVPTNLGPITLKLATMPGFTPIAEALVPAVLNDGNAHAVDVSWRAPSYLSATLHEPDGGLVNVGATNPAFTASPAYFGFTGSTGGVSDSHNEIAGITVTDASCP
jgi:hypothetical protein